MAKVRREGKGSEKRQRTETIRLRLTPAEKAVIQQRANAAGKAPPAYLRLAALGDAGPRSMRARPLPAEHAVRDLIGQLGYVGNNLNQLTRAVNMGDLEEPRELATVLSRLYDLQDAFHALLPNRG